MHLSGVKTYNTPPGQSLVYLATTQSHCSPQGMNFTIIAVNNCILNIMPVKGEQLSMKVKGSCYNPATYRFVSHLVVDC